MNTVIAGSGDEQAAVALRLAESLAAVEAARQRGRAMPVRTLEWWGTSAGQIPVEVIRGGDGCAVVQAWRGIYLWD